MTPPEQRKDDMKKTRPHTSSDNDLGGVRRLAAAVVYRAFKDCSERNGHSEEACEWSFGNGVEYFADVLDRGPDYVQRKLADALRA
jgi:hypothetical protein